MTTILLIEDAPDLAAVVRRELEAEGYEVLHAADGVTALQLFDRHPADLVILDWMPPKPRRAGGAAPAARGVPGARADAHRGAEETTGSSGSSRARTTT